MTTQRDWQPQPEPAMDPLEDGRLRHLHENVSPLRMALAAIGGLLILGAVLYGLNRPHAENEINASRPAPATTAQGGQSK
jgi:hypothetical protein